MLWTIFIGLLVGIVAKFFMPGRDPGGFIITILLGIAGSYTANYLGQMAGMYQPGEVAGFIGSVFGAMLLLLGYRLMFAKKS